VSEAIGGILITGAASGIGRAIALLAAERGKPVGLVDLAREALEHVAQQARELGAPSALALPADVTRESDVERAFAAMRAQGGLDGVVAAAGIAPPGMLHEAPPEHWDRVLATNLGGTVRTCRHALRAFLDEGRGGAIVCVSSPLGVAATPGGNAAYCASKAAVDGLVRSLAVDYGRAGVRVNSLRPGATETPLMWAGVPSPEIPAMRVAVGDVVPLGRLAEPAEPAAAALWLLSPEASYVTGSALVCDGGALARSALPA
jgi:3-oxoacyl-[acyl-carrier protein] reductase